MQERREGREKIEKEEKKAGSVAIITRFHVDLAPASRLNLAHCSADYEAIGVDFCRTLLTAALAHDTPTAKAALQVRRCSIICSWHVRVFLQQQ